MKDELGGKTMKVFVGLKPECYAYLMEDVRVGKKAKRTKKCVIKDVSYLIIIMCA